MIEFEKAKIVEDKLKGKKGVAVHHIHVVAQVNESAAKALGDGVRNTLYNSKGIIRPSFGKMDLTHAFADASFHLSVTGVKGAELRLDGVLAHRFRVAMRGGSEKKPKTLLCAFEVEYVNRSTGASSIELWNFANSYVGAIGNCRLKYPEQEAMFTQAPEAPQMRTFKEGGYTAMIAVSEVPEGYAVIRKAASARGSKLPQKPPDVSPSEQEALAIGAYDIRTWADKIVASAKSKPEKKHAGKLSEWASQFAQVHIPPAPVTITKLAN